MRAANWSLMNRNLVIAEEVLLLLLLERENESRKRKTYERERRRRNGRSRKSIKRKRKRSLVGGRENKGKRNDEEYRTSLGRSNGERGGGGCCGWTANSMRAGKSAMSPCGCAIRAATRGN